MTEETHVRLVRERRRYVLLVECEICHCRMRLDPLAPYARCDGCGAELTDDACEIIPTGKA
jgi:hypothetical protein